MAGVGRGGSGRHVGAEGALAAAAPHGAPGEAGGQREQAEGERDGQRDEGDARGELQHARRRRGARRAGVQPPPVVPASRSLGETVTETALKSVR